MEHTTTRHDQVEVENIWVIYSLLGLLVLFAISLFRYVVSCEVDKNPTYVGKLIT